MGEDFLLESEIARSLYKSIKDAPIYDYYCSLSPLEIAENKKFADLTELWLSGDHYKWRMMRAFGIDESLITGSAGNYEKFLAWAKTVENLIGNPLYHWTHLELQRFFGINEPLTEKSAPSIWKQTNDLINTPLFSIKEIFRTFKVYAVATSDDPVDSLEYHAAIAEGKAPIGEIQTKVIPCFRPDKALDIRADGFAEYIKKLQEASGIAIKNSYDVVTALKKRLDFFLSLGCRSAYHELEYAPYTIDSGNQIEKTFRKAMAGKDISKQEADVYKTKMLILLSNIYAHRDIVMQLNLSIIRNVNPKIYSRVGENAGIDAVNDSGTSVSLSALLGHMELPKTILYSLNPKDYYPIATIMGGFQSPGIEGKMQLGGARWFCEHKDGIEEHLRVLANLGMLPSFVGPFTDSRGFLSFTRHEYFRRILCDLIGRWVDNGEYPRDIHKLEKIVKNISFENAKKYFG